MPEQSTESTASDGQSTPTDLATRVARLEAIEEIRALKLKYARYCDAGYPPEELAALFTEDAVWDGDEAHFGVHRGRDAIRQFFAEISATFIFAMHYTLGGVIDVSTDLQSASGAWYLWEPCTIVQEDAPHCMWVMGNYAEDYRKASGQWRFSTMTVRFSSISRADEGWAQRQFAL